MGQQSFGMVNKTKGVTHAPASNTTLIAALMEHVRGCAFVMKRRAIADEKFSKKHDQN